MFWKCARIVRLEQKQHLIIGLVAGQCLATLGLAIWAVTRVSNEVAELNTTLNTLLSSLAKIIKRQEGDDS